MSNDQTRVDRPETHGTTAIGNIVLDEASKSLYAASYGESESTAVRPSSTGGASGGSPEPRRST